MNSLSVAILAAVLGASVAIALIRLNEKKKYGRPAMAKAIDVHHTEPPPAQKAEPKQDENHDKEKKVEVKAEAHSKAADHHHVEKHGGGHHGHHGGGMSKMKIALGIVAILAFAAATIGALWYTDILPASDIQSGLNWLKANWPLLIIGACALMAAAWAAKKFWKWIGFAALAIVAANYLHLWTFGAHLFQTTANSREQIASNTVTVPASRSVRQEAVWSQPTSDGDLPVNVWSETYEILPGCKASFGGGYGEFYQLQYKFNSKEWELLTEVKKVPMSHFQIMILKEGVTEAPFTLTCNH